MELVVLTYPRFFADESVRLAGLFGEGLKVLHLRKPLASTDQLRRLLDEIPPSYHPYIIVHGEPLLQIEYGLLGVHLPLVALSACHPPMGEVSCSAHTHAEVRAGDEVASRIFVSPVYDSIAKPGYLRAAHWLDRPLPQTKARLVALGGVRAERLSTLRDHGFRAAALMGSLWEAADPLEQFVRCRHYINQETI